jgi:ATP-dependent Clp protease ATP-binding subunit ClpA
LDAVGERSARFGAAGCLETGENATGRSIGGTWPSRAAEIGKVLGEAEKLAQKAGDSFVAVERILTALAMVKSGAKDALDAGAVNAQALNAAINDLRKGRTADSAGRGRL